ncbi:four helix bundle protein [uncultured Proteiniphilum sp.]|uniref:four helix bundle protein n=1 Tax=uncultured Proteiniphilum sp. TaxID=497637 RepID=UPI002634A3FE|nr:four helix bundle protein [uncultured Proteiniphilum sp.]
MAKIERFEDLEVWKISRDFAKSIYLVLENDGFLHNFRFRDQIRASAGSIMDNIAEGFEREGNKEFIQFLFVPKGSCGETRSQLYRALDVGYISEEVFQPLYQESVRISQSLSGFIQYLKSSGIKGPKYK